MMRLLTRMGVSMIVSPKRISSEENNGCDSDGRIAIHGITNKRASRLLRSTRKCQLDGDKKSAPRILITPMIRKIM